VHATAADLRETTELQGQGERVCVFVCERERESERERVCVCERERLITCRSDWQMRGSKMGSAAARRRVALTRQKWPEFHLTESVYKVVFEKVNSRTNPSTYPLLLLIQIIS